MEAKALCESIFQFVGQAKPEHASTSRPSTGTAGIANEVGEGATAAAAATKTTQNGQPTTNDERHYNASPKHQMENEEIIRAFVGNKARGLDCRFGFMCVNIKCMKDEGRKIVLFTGCTWGMAVPAYLLPPLDKAHSPNKLAARIFGAVGCSRLRAESTSWSDRGTGVDPTHPLTLALTLTLIPTRTQNGQENGRVTRLRRFWNFIYSSDLPTTP